MARGIRATAHANRGAGDGRFSDRLDDILQPGNGGGAPRTDEDDDGERVRRAHTSREPARSRPRLVQTKRLHEHLAAIHGNLSRRRVGLENPSLAARVLGERFRGGDAAAVAAGEPARAATLEPRASRDDPVHQRERCGRRQFDPLTVSKPGVSKGLDRVGQHGK